MGNGLKKLAGPQLAHLEIPSTRTMILVHKDDEPIMVGSPLVKGADNRWLFDPLGGYPQWVEGYIAYGGYVADELRTKFFDFALRGQITKWACTEKQPSFAIGIPCP